MDELRSVLDKLTPTDVIWRPYVRCIHQFGQTVYSTLPPDYMMAKDIDVKGINQHQSVFNVIRMTILVVTPYDTNNAYLKWYYCVPHI